MKFIHVDSKNGATYSQNSNYSTFQLVPGSKRYSPNDYNLTVKLSHPILNTKKIYLKSFTTAILFPNVRASSLLNFLDIKVNGGVVQRIALTDKIYINIQSLIDDLNTASGVLFPSSGYLFSLDPTSGTIRVYSSVYTSVEMVDSNLAYVLGFRNGIDSLLTNYCVASYLYNLSHDTYLNLFISNLNAGYSPNTNGVLTSFKIPISAGSYSINHSAQNLSYEEFITISNPNIPINQLDVSIFDWLGFSLHASGARLVFSLGLE